MSNAMDPGSVRLPKIDHRIELKREIARGGMGVVYEARHNFLARPLAVKLVREGLSGSQGERARDRLAREARILGRLDHPNIVRALDAGTLADGSPYLALEMLEGRTLDGILTARAKLGLVEALGMASAVGGALDYAHRRGAVHRDVKPQNVFLVGGSLEPSAVKLIDFGIAGARREESGKERSITRQGELLGTLDYVAPEQIHDVMHADPRSDQYSFAATVFECLTGAPPSWAERAGGGVAKLAAALPEAVRYPLLRALEPNPSARYPKMSDLLSDLEASRSALGVDTMAELTRTERPPEPTRRKHVRAPYVTPLRLLRADGTHVDGRSQDISEGGLLAMLPKAIAEGERVEVRVALPSSGRVVRAPAFVRWAKESRGRAAIGLSFDLEEREAAEDVRRYVELMGSEEALAL